MEITTTLAFGFGSPQDLVIIFVIALLLFGPKKLPELGRQLGQAMREFHKIKDEMMGAVHSVQDEVESVYKPILNPPPLVHSTSSATVENVVTHKPLDQEGEDLMAPAVPHISSAEHPVQAELGAHDADEKGH
jgi:TatA/E family protein of Tat protein translocase